MASFVEITGLLEELADYYGKEMPVNSLLLYIKSLQEFSCSALSEAVLRHVQESPYFPRISELINLAKGIQVDEDLKEARRARWWAAMEALNLHHRGQMSWDEFCIQHEWFIKETAWTEEDEKCHLASIGLERIDECPVCHGSGCDQDDPERIADCPNCQGEGEFPVPLKGEAGAAYRERFEPFKGNIKDLLDENGYFKGWD